MSDPVPHLELIGVSRRFGGVQALDDVTLPIARGSVHGLVGENGAGKSTLGRVIAGVLRPDRGEMLLEGEPVSFRSPRDALGHGITMIAQEPALAAKRSVLDNVFLGAEFARAGIVRKSSMAVRFAQLSERAGFELPASRLVGRLPIAEQQKVAILQALARDAQLIVMDEPTASLTADEAGRLAEIVRTLARSGTTLVYVSHFLEEVLELADTVTVLKDGRLVRTRPTHEETPATLVTAMLGRALDVTFPARLAPAPDSPVVLSARGLTRRGVIEDVSFDVRAGEILGLAGLIGSGRSEVARAVFGALRLESGTITVDGREVTPRSPTQAIAAGIAMLPEDRKAQGLLMRRSIVENITLPHLAAVSRAGTLLGNREEREAAQLAKQVDVRMSGIRAPVDSLSGGNQQKVLFAKWLFREPRVLIADEPTRGVDVGAKRAIYQLLTTLAQGGMAVLLISSELEEVLGLAHRTLVLRAGRVAATFSNDQLSEDQLMHAAFGTEEPAEALT
jgi:simple sugar transport system ATP-binding protein/ribose transport system ATP-binding protein